jgi:hypothetical protein
VYHTTLVTVLPAHALVRVSAREVSDG